MFEDLTPVTTEVMGEVEICVLQNGGVLTTPLQVTLTPASGIGAEGAEGIGIKSQL